jgi:hypothetical protein
MGSPLLIGIVAMTLVCNLAKLYGSRAEPPP